MAVVGYREGDMELGCTLAGGGALIREGGNVNG